MRCPHCGAENADDLQVCTSCGAILDVRDAVNRMVEDEIAASLRETSEPEIGSEQVDELMEQLPTVVAERAAEETRLMDAETRLIDQLPTSVVGEDAASLEGEGALDEGEASEILDEVLAEEQIEKTQLRPPVEGEQQPLDNGGRFVVRNTRDYDHDAQSRHHVKSVGQFATISEPRERDSVRRDPYARSAKRGRVPGEGNSRGRLRPFLAILLVALVLGGGAAVVGYGMELWGGKVVPGVMGSSQATAEERIAEKGLVAIVEPEPADDGIGLVISQDPDPGLRVPEGSAVVLHVATNREMPDVVGKSEGEARTLLAEAGAERIVTKTEPSDEPEGTVIAVNPGVGEAFVSRSDVTLTLAGPYTVPDVIDKKESDAVAAIEAAGFTANVTYINSDKTVRTVVETSPAAGEAHAHGATVEVKVSSPYPTSPYHPVEFFGHSSQDVDGYLKKEGFEFSGGSTNKEGLATALYTSGDKGNIAFTSEPHSHQMTLSQKEGSDVLATGMPFAGVRIDLPSSMVPGEHNRSALEGLAEVCGFTGMTSSCDNKSITLPSGVGRMSTSFGCAAGKMDDLVWSVIVVGEGSSAHATVTCAREGLYPSSELAGFNDDMSQYVAYQEVYVSYQVVQRQEQERKEAEQKQKDEHKEGQENQDGQNHNNGEN